MRLRFQSALVVLTLVLLGAAGARATLSTEYLFSVANAPYVSPTGTLTTLIAGTNSGVGTFNDQAVSPPTAIGFNFTFNGVDYSTFRVNAHGLVTLGDSTTNSGANDLAGAQWPTIATWWDSQHMYDGGGPGAGCTMTPPMGVRYGISGSLPNRVLTIEFNTQVRDNLGSYWWAGCGSPMLGYQVRLYEATSRIEMHYRTLWASAGQPLSGSIGLSSTPGDFISVTPVGVSATTSSAVSNNAIAPHLTPIQAGTIYTFTPCMIRVTGRTAQPTDGGTVNMMPGDTLLADAAVKVNEMQSYTPADLSISDGACPTRNYQLSISGAAAADYYFGAPGMQTLNGSATSAGPAQTPTITFAPTTLGRRYATLTLTDQTNNHTRSWVLGAMASVAMVEFTKDNLPLDTITTIARHDTACVGDQTVAIPFDVNLTGNLPVVIRSIEIYQTDTVMLQGDADFRYRRDRFGNVIPSYDYYVSATPDGAPLATPDTITGPTRLYIIFDPQRADARYSRMIIRTDAANLNELDTNGVPTEGLIDVGLYGRGRGSRLSSTVDGHKLRGVEMGTVRVGERVQRWLPIANSGRCEIRISRGQFQIASGDVSEFRIEALSPNLTATADADFYRIQPGAIDSVLISFRPTQIGSRRASMYLRTNDSMIGGDGVIERGDYIIDLTGEGATGLYAAISAGGTDLGTGMIGDPVGPFAGGIVRLNNTGTGPAEITSLTMTGTDAADFVEVAATPWIQTPFVIPAGATVDLAVEFRPMTGTPGPRSAALRVVTSGGTTVNAPLMATAGTRELSVDPVALTFPTIRPGRIARKTVNIVNSGTLPVTIEQPVVGGTDPTLFSVTPMPRLELAPGQAEFMEITFRPTTTGASSATVTLGTNTMTGPITITLNGSANSTRYVDDDPIEIGLGNGGLDRPDDDTTQIELVAGVNGTILSTLRLDAIVPNPAGDQTTVRFTNRTGRDAVLSLVDAWGTTVWTNGPDAVVTGSGFVTIPVRSLPSGVYMLRLSDGTTTQTGTLVITR